MGIIFNFGTPASGGIETASNGLTATGTDVALGGKLDGFTSIDLNGSPLFINSTDFSSAAQFGDGTFDFATLDIAADYEAFLGLDGSAKQINLLLTKVSTGNQQGLSLGDSFDGGALLTDEIDQIGMLYRADISDYSIKGRLLPNWIPPQSFVKTLVTTISSNMDDQDATINLITYPVDAVNDTPFVIGGFLSVTNVTVGTVELSCSYTDTSGNPQTISLGAAFAALGDSSYNPIVIKAQAGSNVSVDATVTGDITFNTTAYASQIF